MRIRKDELPEVTKEELREMDEAVIYLKEKGFFEKRYSGKKDAK